MILEGNERGYGAKLAEHLMNPRDNDHVTIHAIDGFMADDLFGAFAEVDAVSQATQCQKYLFSLSLNPPIGAIVSVEAFEKAIADVERKLGLVGQPRAIVFHEKNGRHHAHCVWSRVDALQMKAIKLSHYKRKLGDISQELYLTHKWDMPEGFEHKAKRDPLNYSREEHGQAKRLKHDPKDLKAKFQKSWQQSDSLASFKAALKDHGFLLARGDRRGFVAVDANGKIWSLSRWCDVKTKDLRARLGDEKYLPSIEAVISQLQDVSFPNVDQEVSSTANVPDAGFVFKRSELIARQRKERTDLIAAQKFRKIAALKARHARLPKGLKALFLKASGSYQKLVLEFEAEVEHLRQLDNREQQALINRHLGERRSLERDAQTHNADNDFNATLESALGNDPNQTLDLPLDSLPFTRNQLLQNPALVLGHVSKMKASFERIDVLNALAKRIDDPFALKDATDKALQSAELIRLDDKNAGNTPSFTTHDYQQAEERLYQAIHKMASTNGYGVASRYVAKAVRTKNSEMKREFGGRLSKEQLVALDHILGKDQYACIIGLAGAGKSTLLAIAMEAWKHQGITVHGATLAGKAADGLETASGIKSRTLASLETSWENGYEPIQKGDVLVVDEAGMISTRQLSRIAAKIEELGAKLVLVGDPDQLQPIEAGTPFRNLVKHHNSANLTEIHRQRSDWQKLASQDLAKGNISDAVNIYSKHNAVKHGKARNETIEALVEAYAMDIAANGTNTTRLAFAHRRKDVHALNQAIRAALKWEDRLQPEVLFQTEIGKRAFAEGDRIVFSRNDRELDVKNGMLGTVSTVSETKLAVLLDGEPPLTVTFDPRKYTNFDHGYAVTIHKSQGATVNTAYVLTSRSMDRHLAYVAMTRHRDNMHLYINEMDQPNWVYQQRKFERQQKHGSQQRSGPSIG